MGLFDILCGRNKANMAVQPSTRLTPKKVIFNHDNFIEIPSLSFFGEFRKSPSGEWLICWSYSDTTSHSGGHQDSGYGRYVLFNLSKNEIALQGRLQCPNSGVVADNGNFSIEDWHFGNELSSTFYVFSSVGQELTKRRFEANLYNSTISSSGRYAICQTANNPGKEDGNRLTAFDVERNVQLFSIHPPTGWADKYRFDEDIPKFGVFKDRIGTFYYDARGNFVDSEQFLAARLNCDRYDVILLAAEEILKAPELDDQLAEIALEAATRALLLGANRDPYRNVLALKMQGLAHEFLHNYKEAVTAFDEALKINPKIGVKRKADSLRKNLAQ